MSFFVRILTLIKAIGFAVCVIVTLALSYYLVLLAGVALAVFVAFVLVRSYQDSINKKDP